MEDYKGRTYKQLKFIYWFTIVLLIAIGWYYNYTGSSTGGTLYSRYGGSAEVSYSGNGMYIMAGALLAGFIFLKLLTKKKDRR